MNVHTPDRLPGTWPDETTFRGKSPWRVCLLVMFLSLVIVGWAAVVGLSVNLQARLEIEPSDARGFSFVAGGFAIVLFLFMAWLWYAPLKWVAVSGEGIRWNRDRRTHTRRWDEFVRVQRGAIQMVINGQKQKPGHYADVEFRHGKALRIAPSSIDRYEDLIAALNDGFAAWAAKTPIPGVRIGLSERPVEDPDVATFGPLRFDADGMAWGKTHYRWDEIESYELAVGYLRIKPVEGDEFLRRLTDLGDYRLAVARLDTNCGSRRVGRVRTVPRT